MGELNLALALEGRVKAAPENAQMVAIAEALSNLPDPEIDQRFMLALEQRLLTEDLGTVQPTARLRAVPAIPPTPADEVVRRAPVVQMPKRRFAVRRSLVAAAAAASLAAFPVVAAASSLPGSPFHGLKLKIEEVQLAMFGTPVEDAFTNMDRVQLRVTEAEQLEAMGADASRIALALELAEDHMRDARRGILTATQDPTLLRKLAEAAHRTEMQLRDAASALAPQAQAEFADALGLSVGIQDAVARALGLDVTAAPVVTDPTATALPATTVFSGDDASGDPKQAQPNGQRSTDDGQRNKDKATHEVTEGAGKKISETTEGCQIPGSEDGLGDLLAPVAKAMCTS